MRLEHGRGERNPARMVSRYHSPRQIRRVPSNFPRTNNPWADFGGLGDY
jgi:hypothetical protein